MKEECITMSDYKEYNAAIYYDNSISTIVFAVKELASPMESIGYKVREVDLNKGAAGEKIEFIITTVEAANGLCFPDKPMPGPHSAILSQGYIIKKVNNEKGIKVWVLGADDVGAMYGTLDVAHTIKTQGSIEGIHDVVKNPYIKNRGIKFNIPLDARTPSYSDGGDSAQKNIENMWDFEFWKEFLDEMARNKYNVLSLWNLHPFPSMVKVPEYPDIALNDVMKTTALVDSGLEGREMSNQDVLKNLVVVKEMTINEKIEFWNRVMKYAKYRGIDTYIFTWNIFVFGTEGNSYGIDASQANDVTIDYFRKSVRTLFETYPLLAGIGVTAGENMLRSTEGEYSDENWLMKTYGEGIKDVLAKQPGRNIKLIHRAHYTALSSIDKAFENYPIPFEYSFKYSQAHMYAAVRPVFGDGFFKELKPGKKTWLTVRNDDFYMYRWGDPGFAREYIMNMPSSDKLAGFYMGPDGYTWGREYISTEPDTPRQQVIKKMWYSFAIWGRLAYDPNLPDSYFQDMLALRFPEVDSGLIYKAWTSASKIIPLVNRVHWHDLDFQWYPEACYSLPRKGWPTGFHDIQDFIDTPSALGTEYISVSDYVDAYANNKEITGITPLQVIEELNRYVDLAISSIRKIGSVSNKELRLTLGDIEAMSYLGQYYSTKILAAIDLGLYQRTGNEGYKVKAVENLKTAADCWERYAEKSRSLYNPQRLTRMRGIVDVKELKKFVGADIAFAEKAEYGT